MSILRDVERILQLVLALYGSLNPGDGRILVRTHIHDIIVALILNRATGIVSLDGIVAIYESLARTSLVTQTPDYYRRMIHGSVYHLHISGDMSIAELRYMRKTLLAIVVLMALEVSFILQIDTILIAEIIPVRCIRIVAVAHMVDVSTLHQEDFVLHLFAGSSMT